MCLRFKLTLGVKQVNDIMNICGTKTKLVAKDVVTVQMKQTVPFIPTDEIIAKYAEVIKNKYESKEFTCEKCTFDGFEYIREVDDKQSKNAFYGTKSHSE